jgi:hypothetical protein
MLQAQDTTPWWQTAVQGNKGMQIFAPGVKASIQEARKPIPQGLSTQDMANMKSRLAGQNQLSTQNGLANMASQMGGTASPAFAMQASRLQAGAGQAASAKMADVNIDETRNNQSLQMARRGQMTDAAKLGLGYGNTLSDWWKGMAGNDAQNAAVQLDRDKWAEWVARNRANAQQAGNEARGNQGSMGASNVSANPGQSAAAWAFPGAYQYSGR